MPRSRRASLRNRPRQPARRASRSRGAKLPDRFRQRRRYSPAGAVRDVSNVVWMDLRAAADRFLESPSLSDGTRRAYRGDVDEFCGWLETRRIALEQVDIRVLSEYVS